MAFKCLPKSAMLKDRDFYGKTHFPPKSAMLKDRDFEENFLKIGRVRTSAKSAGY